MQYYKMICEQPEEKEALVLNDKSYTYGDLQLLVSKGAKVLLSKETSKIHIIRKEHILEQLIDFLACNAVGIIPLIMPNDCKITKEEVWQLAQNELEKIDKKTDTTKVWEQQEFRKFIFVPAKAGQAFLVCKMISFK